MLAAAFLCLAAAFPPPSIFKVNPVPGGLETARDLLRAGRGASGRREVHLAAGYHFLSRPLTLDKRDSASADAPVLWTTAPSDAAAGQYAHVSGGLQVPAHSFSPVQVPSGAQGVLVADLFALGLNASSLGGMGTKQYPAAKLELFYGNEPQVLARDPNIGTDSLRTWQWVGYETVKVSAGRSLIFNDTARGAVWAKALNDQPDSSLSLHGYWKFDWRDGYVQVESIRQLVDGAYNITRTADSVPGYPPKDGCRFYALNALRLLDAPGEYFVSRTGRLYFYPPGGALTADVIVSVQPHVLIMDGVQHHTFRDLIISTSQKGAVVLTSSDNVSFINCSITNSGGEGACLSISGDNNTVVQSVISGCAAAGVSVHGGDTVSLRGANTTVESNTISNFSRLVRTYRPGVAFSGVGLRVAHNNISHSPHACIQGGGSNHLFEYNRLEHCVYECIDAGAFYVGRSWAQRGNVVRFNIFDTVRPTERLAQKSCSQNAFYLDDQMSGYDFYGNTIINATQGVLIGGGRHNLIHGNKFVACDLDVAIDCRGLNWQNASCQKNCSATMGNMTTSCFANALNAVRYLQPPYATAFPELVDIYDYHPGVPVGNTIEDNVYCHRGSRPGKGIFLDRTDEQVRRWLSRSSNNREEC